MNRIIANVWCGDLLPVRLDHISKGRHYYWEFLCHCGADFVAEAYTTLNRGHCGCRTITRWDVRPPESERFLKWVEKRENGCWEWIGHRNAAGYGKYLKEIAPRAAYRIFKGAIPSGALICHKCDNPSCVNPDHLYAGNHQTNMDDCLVRGRMWKECGTARWCAKLNEEKVLAILHLVMDGVPILHISRQFGVARSVIYHIAMGTRWRHVPRPEGFEFDTRFKRGGDFYEKERARKQLGAVEWEKKRLGL